MGRLKDVQRLHDVAECWLKTSVSTLMTAYEKHSPTMQPSQRAKHAQLKRTDNPNVEKRPCSTKRKQIIQSMTKSIQYLYTLFIYITESSTHPPPPPVGYASSSAPQPASSLCFTAYRSINTYACHAPKRDKTPTHLG